MENIRKTEQKAIAPMSLRDVSVALLENSARIVKASPIDAAYVAGYIARVIETAEASKHSA